MTIVQLINRLISKGYRILFVGGSPLFYFVVEKTEHLKLLLTRYSSLYKTFNISGNGYGTGITVIF